MTEINDEFNLLSEEVSATDYGAITIEVETTEDGDTAISFGHKNLSRVEAINLLAYVLDQYVADLGVCICGQCDDYVEDDE